jgi:hypothetical protein
MAIIKRPSMKSDFFITRLLIIMNLLKVKNACKYREFNEGKTFSLNKFPGHFLVLLWDG